MAMSRIALCIYTLAVVYEGCCSPVVQTSLSFSNSLRLTRTLRARVQQFLQRYKEQQFGDRNFEDRRLILNTLPSITINYKSWIQMQDTERLYLASRGLYTFWKHLEAQRHKLEVEQSIEHSMEHSAEQDHQRRSRRERPHLSLAQDILGIQLDVRDLLKQVNFQLLSIDVTREGPTSGSTQAPPPPGPFSNPTPHTRVSHALQSLKPSHTSLPTSHPMLASSSPTADMSMPKPSHSALGMIHTTNPWDMEYHNVRRITSNHEETTQASKVTLPREGKLPSGKTTTSEVLGPSRWVSRLEGYVILRDLERYLSRLARDYTLLRAKY